jgi:hypothetical protein
MRISESKIRQIIREETRRVIAEVDLREDPEELMQKFRDAQLEIAPNFMMFRGSGTDLAPPADNIKHLVDMINQKFHDHVIELTSTAASSTWKDGQRGTSTWKGRPAPLVHKLSIESLESYMEALQAAMQARGVEIDFLVDKNFPSHDSYRPAYAKERRPDPLLKIEVVESDNEERDTRNNF